MLKKALHDITSEPGMANSIVNALIGLGSGILSKRLFIGGSHNIFKKLVGVAVEFGVAGMVAKKGEEIKATIGGAVKKLFTISKNNNHKSLNTPHTLY